MFNTKLSAPYTLCGDVTIGGFYTGHRRGGSVSLSARPNDKLNLGLRLGYNDVRLREGNFHTTLVGLSLAEPPCDSTISG